MSKFKTVAAAVIGCAIIGGVGFIGFAQYGEHKSFAPIPVNLLTGDAAQLQRGQYVAAAGDCAACHTVPGGQTYAGGYTLQTPFGTIKASNITQDADTGIGGWSLAQFDKAVRHGVGKHGYLYPAMPYNAYTKMSDQDIADLYAYIKTVPAVKQKVVENELPFPFNQRMLLAGWNLLFFKDARFAAVPGVTALVARGDYLVNGPGHCAACHTAKNLLGGDVAGTFQGGTLQGWHAPDLTPNPHTGLGQWKAEDIVSYLKTGTSRQAAAAGPMLEAVENSTQYLTDDDLHAITAYLQQLPASQAAVPVAVADTDPQMVKGRLVFESQCEACHTSSGAGVRQMIPELRNNAQVNAKDPSSLLNVVLKGADGPLTAGNPTGAGMPRFDWKLADEDIAAVQTYIRNSWGNSASKVTAEQVKKARGEMGAQDWMGH
jgi:mono/diheme cytochrome c family protein